MRKWLIRLLLLATVIAVVLVLRATWLAPQPIPVQVVTVARGRVEETVTNSRAGTVRARRRAKLSPETGGRVVELRRREGDTVRAGEVLLRLDDSQQRAQVEVAASELASSQAQHERACLEARRAERERDRIQRLAADGVVSQDDLDAAQTAAEAGQAACRAAATAVDQARANVSLQRTLLGRMTLQAPFDGVVADLAVELGEWVTPSPPGVPIPAVIDILDPGSIYVSAPMDEVDSARIRPGQPVRLTVDSYRGREFAGRVTRVAPYVLDVEDQNRTVEIEVELDDSAFAATLLPGTSADVEVILDARENVLRLPTSALIEGQRALVLAGERLEERPVSRGLRNWNFTEITGGLSEGELVVSVLDRPEIRDGALARRADAAAASAAPAPPP